MSIVKKTLLIITMIAIALMIKSSSLANEYIWPIGGENANETYMDYNYYGRAYAVPYKDGKSGREYIVNNELWPDEEYYYISCESNYGMDITGINGHEYSVVSVCDGVVIATSANRAKNPSTDYVDRNKRRSYGGINDGSGYGNYVIVEETNTGRCFMYTHLKGGTVQVSKGDSVSIGQALATMGSSGDSGHMNLHFEIRKSKEVTLSEDENGNHYLILTNSSTNLDPEKYIGTKSNIPEVIEDENQPIISENEPINDESKKNIDTDVISEDKIEQTSDVESEPKEEQKEKNDFINVIQDYIGNIFTPVMIKNWYR